jgi:hypothetical protein
MAGTPSRVFRFKFVKWVGSLSFFLSFFHYLPQEDLAKFGKEVREESRKS